MPLPRQKLLKNGSQRVRLQLDIPVATYNRMVLLRQAGADSTFPTIVTRSTALLQMLYDLQQSGARLLIERRGHSPTELRILL